MCNPDFKIALEGGCDFGDVGMRQVWHISEYVMQKRLGLPTCGIIVENDGVRDMIVEESELIDFMKKNDIHPSWMKEVSG